MTEETLVHRTTRLQTLIDKAKEFHSGEQLAQRIEGDLNRIMNSAYLNLVDAIDAHEQKTGKRDHSCLTNRAFNSNRCLICAEEIEYPEGWKAKEDLANDK